MNYKQLFLLILTIWTAELVTRFLFDMLLTPSVEYRTVYLKAEKEDGMFHGKKLTDTGRDGWQLISAVPNPEDKDVMILFFQRRRLW
jgi:hypothetical protein